MVAALPENFAFMGRGEADKLAIAEAHGAGPIQAFLADAGAHARAVDRRRHGAARACPASRASRRHASSTTTRAASVARYDKIHLFDVDMPGKRESATANRRRCDPAREPSRVDTPAGRLGLAVCYDVRFPELFRELLQQGAEWFSLPSAFTVPTGRAHWEVLLRARAIENLCYLVAPAQSGFHENGRETHGDSMIVDRWGRVLARLPRGTGVITAELDLARQRRGAGRISLPSSTAGLP